MPVFSIICMLVFSGFLALKSDDILHFKLVTPAYKNSLNFQLLPKKISEFYLAAQFYPLEKKCVLLSPYSMSTEK